MKYVGVSVGTLVTKAYILEAAISTHTIIIGFGFGSLGNSQVLNIKVLMAAFAFHQVKENISVKKYFQYFIRYNTLFEYIYLCISYIQFFEGISLGTALSGASSALGMNYIYALLFLFSITFDIGIILGTSKQYSYLVLFMLRNK